LRKNCNLLRKRLAEKFPFEIEITQVSERIDMSTVNIMSRENYFAHPTAVIDEGCDIGEGVKIWHFSHLMPGCKIGEGCNLGQNVVVSPKVVLGKNVRVQNNVFIYEGLICEDDMFLRPSMAFTNVINPRSNVSWKHEYKQTLVGKAPPLVLMLPLCAATRSVNMPFVGDGAVITRLVPAYALVVGNPTWQIGWMNGYGQTLAV